MKFGKRLLVAVSILFISASVELRASTDSPAPSQTSFAYLISHTVKPLPDAVIDRITDPYIDSLDSDMSEMFEPPEKPVDVRVGAPRQMSRDGLCSAISSVAQANELPIPFFANLIWTESSFDTKTISRAGAQGIAQFMPRTAVEFGLINPFEPIHALNVAGKFVRELHQQFGNLGLAAAAYNAGPRRVTDWIARRGELPTETRNYVIKITGRPAEQWLARDVRSDPEMTLMPGKAPCSEVAEAVEAQVKTVRMARLVLELAAAAQQTRDKPQAAPPPVEAEPAVVAVTEDAAWQARALRVVRAILRQLAERKPVSRMAAKAAIKTAIRIVARDFNKPDQTEEKSPAPRAGKATGKTSGAKSNKLADQPAAKAEAKDSAKTPAAKESGKAASKPAIRYRRARPTVFAYSHNLTRPY